MLYVIWSQSVRPLHIKGPFPGIPYSLSFRKSLNMASISVSQFENYFRQAKNFDKALQKVNILEAGDGKCKAELKISEEHTNSAGGLHGGLSATLVDVISTCALMTLENGRGGNVSVDIHCSYLKAAKLGDEIVIEANTLKAGKTLAFLEVLIKNKANGDLLVKGSHTTYLMQAK